MRSIRESLRVVRSLFLVAVLALSGCVSSSGQQGAEDVSGPAPRMLPAPRAVATAPDWGRLPLYFVQNQGQLDPRVGYSVGLAGAMSYFTAEGVTYGIVGRPDEHIAGYWADAAPADEEMPRRRWVVKVDFLGSDLTAQPAGVEQTDAVFSIFKGAPEEWRTSIPTYRGVTYQAVWPGIDAVYSSEQGRLKYAMIVQPGADPGRIALGYRGVSAMYLAEDGSLVASTPLGSIHEQAPLTYQDRDGQRAIVPSRFVLASDADSGIHQVGFEVGPYDHSLPLVIDPPVLVYAGYIGGGGTNGLDDARGIAVDDDGSAYVGGATTSTEATFPETVGPDLTFAGSVDAMVAKLSETGSGLVYAGYVGGTQRDDGLSVVVDGAGNAYLTGQTLSTQSTGFPLTAGAFDATQNGSSDVFVTKVNPTGTVVLYSTFVGGSGFDSGQSIALEPGCASSCSVYITGETSSTNLFPNGLPGPDPTFNSGTADAFIFKLNTAASALSFGGYIGGDATERGVSVSVDGAGRAHIAGITESTQATFPNGNGFGGGAGQVNVPGLDQTYNGLGDAFVAKLQPDGTAYVFVTYLGGSDIEDGPKMGIAIDLAGSVYVAGETRSTGSATIPFPALAGPDTSHAGVSDVYVTKLSGSDSTILYSGFIGGSGVETVGRVTVDSIGNAYVGGRTNSSTAQGFPAANGPDSTFGGNVDGFVAKVRADGSGFVFVTYLGGTLLDEVSAIALDAGGSIYVTGGSLSTESQSFPVLVGPDLTHNGGGIDMFVAKIGVTADLALSITDSPDPIVAGAPLTYTLNVINTGPDDVLNVTLSDPLPAGATLVSATPAQGTCTGASIVVCSLGGLANGLSTSVQIVVTPSTGGALTNTATVTARTADPNTGNNTATTTTTVSALADLVTGLSISPNPGIVSGALTYLVTVNNAGPSTASNVTATVTWPAGVTFGSAAPAQGTCTPSPGQVNCALGALPNGTTLSIAIVVTPSSPATITTTASAVSPDADPNLGNNTVTTNTNIVAGAGLADLALVLSDSPDPAVVGSSLIYTATVTNNGPNSATSVQVNMSLPNSVTFLSVTPSQGTCSQTGLAVSCALGTMASGATASASIAVTPNDPGTIAVTGNLTSGVPDAALGNNTSAQSTVVSAVPVNPNSCQPRPEIRTLIAKDSGSRLRVTFIAGTNASTPVNTLSQLRFGNATNALIDIVGGASGLTGNTTVTLPSGPTETTIFISRQSATAANGAATVPVTVVDRCGDFATFVGGGPAAFP